MADAWVVTGEVEAHLRFGPQGVHVAALIEAMRTMTPEQARTAWAAARAAAWDAARAAARRPHEMMHPAPHPTTKRRHWSRAAAGAAAWDAARDAAWDAAGALGVRDLIGQHDLTQEHYDALTRPWREVIGPVHPDDGPLP